MFTLSMVFIVQNWRISVLAAVTAELSVGFIMRILAVFVIKPAMLEMGSLVKVSTIILFAQSDATLV